MSEKKIAVVTDSCTDVPKELLERYGIYVLPVVVQYSDRSYLDRVEITEQEVYDRLEREIPTTSLPEPEYVIRTFDRIVADGYDTAVVVTMSSGLSGSCQTAMMLADDYDGRVHVVDNQRISVTQKLAVFDAVNMVKAGMSAAQIKEKLTEEKLIASIYIMVDTLKYLKKGGRITPAAAMLGTVLKLKPVLTIQGEKLDAYAKVRGQKQAKKTMIEAMKKDMEERFAEERKAGLMELAVAHTNNFAEAESFKAELQNVFPDVPLRFVDPLSLSVSCHIGPGALAVACAKRSQK